MSKYVLAISGGIDSVALLDMFDWPTDTIVAHFNHGIRESADADCLFVEKLARQYGFRFESARLPLGSDCSEELARRCRYDFLKSLASKNQATLVTAHHADDCIESMAINILRGTGWRGIAPFGDRTIFRPMLNLTKADIYRYAAAHQLVFRQDQTNNDDEYLRNRLRRLFSERMDSGTKQQLLQIYQRQVNLRQDIEQTLDAILGDELSLSCDLLDSVKSPENVEILRAFLSRHNCPITRPQAERCLQEIKKFAPGKKYSLDKTHFLLRAKYNYRLVER